MSRSVSKLRKLVKLLGDERKHKNTGKVFQTYDSAFSITDPGSSLNPASRYTRSHMLPNVAPAAPVGSVVTCAYVFIHWLQYIIQSPHSPAQKSNSKTVGWRRHAFIHILFSECEWAGSLLWMYSHIFRRWLVHGINTRNPPFKQSTEDSSAPLPLLIFSCQCWCSGSLSGVDGYRT